MKTISKTSVALGETDRRIVNRVALKLGLNFSSAVRVIGGGGDEPPPSRYQITEAGAEALASAKEDSQRTPPKGPGLTA